MNHALPTSYPVPRLDRRIVVAIVVSMLAHIALVAIPMRPGTPSSELLRSAEAPLSVRILPAPAPASPEPLRLPEPIAAAPAAKPLPRPAPVPRLQAPQPLPAPVEVPSQEPEPPKVAIAEPKVDMLAAIERRRAIRRAAEEVLRRKLEAPPPEPDDPVLRNLQTITASDTGVSGVFQVLSKGTRSGQFAFNGWRTGSQQKWRQVIEVDAGPGGDVERAMIRRMIELIRMHYSGDFNWISQRLGRTVVLSARPADQEGLEDFMMRELFGTPTLGRASR